MVGFNEYDDLIDSRDVVARIEELEGERIDWTEDQVNVVDHADCPDLDKCWSVEFPDDSMELEELREFVRDMEGYANGDTARDGITLIRESYFEEYAKDLAEDCGMIPKDNSWPLTHIDWGSAAEELLMDYTGIEFRHITYYVR